MAWVAQRSACGCRWSCSMCWLSFGGFHPNLVPLPLCHPAAAPSQSFLLLSATLVHLQLAPLTHSCPLASLPAPRILGMPSLLYLLAGKAISCSGSAAFHPACACTLPGNPYQMPGAPRAPHTDTSEQQTANCSPLHVLHPAAGTCLAPCTC